MKHRIASLLLAAVTGLTLCACQRGTAPASEPDSGLVIFTEETAATADAAPDLSFTEETDPETEITEEETAESETEEETTQEETTAAPETTTAVPDTIPEDEALPAAVEKDGSYTSPEDVAEYIHNFGTLPANFITKKQAQKKGWVSSEGNLWDVAPGMSIGGDYFGNREGLLPDGDYHECDVNYAGGFRGGERLIYGDDGSIYYTNDHYKSFTQLY